MYVCVVCLCVEIYDHIYRRDPAVSAQLGNLDGDSAKSLLRKTVQFTPLPQRFFASGFYLAQKLVFNPCILDGILRHDYELWDLVVSLLRVGEVRLTICYCSIILFYTILH